MRGIARVLALSIALAVTLPPTPVVGVTADELDLAGRTWEDTDADGLRDRGEGPSPGIIVLLLGPAAGADEPSELDRATTDADGAYAFRGLDPGSYQVAFLLPDDTAFTYRDVGDDNAVDSDPDRSTGRTDPVMLVDSPVATLDAGLLRIPDFTLITGWVWEDWDDDGIQDRGDEVPLGDVTVQLLRESRPGPRRGGRNRRGSRRQPTFEVVRTTRSGGLDRYEFYVPIDGTRYRVQVVPPEGYETVLRDQGGDDELDSDVDPVSRRSDPVNAREDRFLDIGLAPLSFIADRAWLDEDGDGIQGLDEPDLPDTFVFLYRFDAQANVFTFDDLKITDEAGAYEFGPRRPGSYYLRFLPPPQHGFTTFQVGDDESVDSDAMEDTGATPDIVLPDDAVDPLDVQIRRLVAGLARAFASLGEGPEAGPDGDAELPGGGGPGGAAGGVRPLGRPFRTPVWDAGLIPGTGLPEFTVSVDDGPVVCGTDRRVRDREVTISGVRTVRLPSGDWVVLVRMARGLEDDYSFAVVLHVRTPAGTVSFVWETHDRNLRIGRFDPQTGEILQPTGEDLQIANVRDLGIVAFVIGDGLIPDDADLAAVQSFHSPNRRSMTRCHMTPTFEVPQP